MFSKRIIWDKLATAEIMAQGLIPDVFSGGASNLVQKRKGLIRNTGRDELNSWLSNVGIWFYDPQIHKSTHGRDYNYDLDGPAEKRARFLSKLRIYEINPHAISGVTHLEIMNDALNGRESIVWFPEGRVFTPDGIGNRKDFYNNEKAKRRFGKLHHYQLWALAYAGEQLRNELPKMLVVGDKPVDCIHIIDGDLKSLISLVSEILKI